MIGVTHNSVEQLYCKNCGWELEPNAVCPNICPECGEYLYVRYVKI